MTNSDEQLFLHILNGVIKKAVDPDMSENISSLDENVKDFGLDSLDTALIYTYITEIYGVDDLTSVKSEGDVKFIKSLRSFYDFVQKNKSRIIESAEKALEDIK